VIEEFVQSTPDGKRRGNRECQCHRPPDDQQPQDSARDRDQHLKSAIERGAPQQPAARGDRDRFASMRRPNVRSIEHEAQAGGTPHSAPVF